VLRTLLFGFMNAKSGRCDPSYSDPEARTGFCRDTIAKCIKALEASGLLVVTRRMVRVVIGRVLAPRQISNAYAFGEPKIAAAPVSAAPVAERPARGFPAKASPLEAWLKALRSPASLNRREQPHQSSKKGIQGELFAGLAAQGGAS
jgi:hypothetical protein